MGDIGRATLADLAKATAFLSNSSATDAERLEDVLAALQQVSATLLYLETADKDGEGLQPELCITGVAALAQGLATVRAGTAGTAGSALAVLRRDLWCGTLLPLVDALFHSSRWYMACQRQSGAMEGGPYYVVRDCAREMVKASFLPLVADAVAAQSSSDGGLHLARLLHMVLDLARTAASILGMQDERGTHYPHMRYYGLVGVLWNGLTKLWTGVPPELRAVQEAAGLGADVLLGCVAGNLCNDLASLAVRLEATDVKLMVFWVQHLFRLVQAFPEAAPAAWPALLRCTGRARTAVQELRGLSATHERAGAVVEAMVQSQLEAKASKLLACCLGAMAAEHDVRAAIDSLRSRLADGSRPGRAAEAAALLPATLGLLQQAASMSGQLRHMCLPLLDATMSALMGAAFAAGVDTPVLRAEVADGLLAFLAACCAAAQAASTTGQRAEDEAGKAEQQLAVQTWARCQQQLLLLALQPHPLIAQVLGQVWADLVASSEEPFVRQHIMILNSLLHTTAAAEAAAATGSAGLGWAPPTPLALQLTGVLACVLAAAPERVRAGYFANCLVVSDPQDICRLAALAAELRLAAVVDGAVEVSTAAALVAAALQHLMGALESSMDGVLQGLGVCGTGVWATEVAIWLAQLLDALRGAVSYLATAAASNAEPLMPRLGSLAAATVRLLTGTPQPINLRFANPALGLLRALQLLNHTLLSSNQLRELLPLLLGWAEHSELVTAVAGLAAAYKASGSVPHAQLFHGLLTHADPLARHAGMEAYADYVRGCPPHCVRSAVPAVLQDAASGAPTSEFLQLTKQYLSRAVSLDAHSSSAEVMAGWTGVLQNGASAGVAQLLRAVETARSMQPVSPPVLQRAAAEQPPSKGVLQAVASVPAAVCAEESDHSSDVSAAVAELVHAVKQVEGALRRAGGTELAVHKTLRKCAARLEHIAQS